MLWRVLQRIRPRIGPCSGRNKGGKACPGSQFANQAHHAQSFWGHKRAARHGHHIASVALAQAKTKLAAPRGVCSWVWPKGKFHLVAKARASRRGCNCPQQGFKACAFKPADATQGIESYGALPEKLLLVGHGLQRAAAAFGVVRANGWGGIGGLAHQFMQLGLYK